MADGEEEFEDAASLVDAVFGVKASEDQKPEAAEAVADEAEADEAEADEAEADEAGEASAASAEADTVDGGTAEAESAEAEEAETEAVEVEAAEVEIGEAEETLAESAEAEPAPAESSEVEETPAESAEAEESLAESAEAEAEPVLAELGEAEETPAETADAATDADAAAQTEAPVPDIEPAAVAPSHPRSLKLTRGRLVAAAAVVLGVATASVMLLSGGSSGNAAAPTAAPSTLPSVNPQAFYPVQSATPFATGGTSELTDAQVQAAVPDCDRCKLVTRANKFSPDGDVLALLRTGAPQGGKSNAKLVVVGGDGKLVWSAPAGFKALTAGIERFSVDAAGNFYLALPGAKYGQVLVVLAWHDGKVLDLGGLAEPKIKSDSIVGVLPQAASGATATIVSQTTAGVPDADTGGLVESQYQIRDGAPVLTGCRRHVGESGQWLTFQPSADGCTHWPAGPVGPPDDDDAPTGSTAPH